jgi:hypothetical protein
MIFMKEERVALIDCLTVPHSDRVSDDDGKLRSQVTDRNEVETSCPCLRAGEY